MTNAATSATKQPAVHYKTAKINDLDIFYRDAGAQDAPVILLLHGFPTSSNMFRNLIPRLAGSFRVIAPDYPGFGQSSMPDHKKYAYTFANYADVVDKLVEQLDISADELTFTPHLLPIPRGILSTMYVHLNRQMTAMEVESCYRTFYAGKRWVRVFQTPKLPQVQFALHSNYCDLGFCLAADGRRLVVVSCIDNLVKGAAGQAVQNMNLMYGWAEDEGLQ